MSQTEVPPAYLPYGRPIELAAALTVIAAATAECARRDWPMAVAVADSTGHLVAVHRMDQTQHAGIALAIEKALSAVSYRRSTIMLEDALSSGGANLRLLAMRDALPVAGGVPLVDEGALIGAVGVSGMQAAQDQEIAIMAAKALPGTGHGSHD